MEECYEPTLVWAENPGGYWLGERDLEIYSPSSPKDGSSKSIEKII